MHFAIVGGGLTGTAMLYQIVEETRRAVGLWAYNPTTINVSIFERKESFGPGFPHCGRNALPIHITNMCAKDMGILPDNPADFQEWVRYRRNELKKRFPYLNEASFESGICRHYPRAIMGAYLKKRFQDACQRARTMGMRVDLYPQTEVVDLMERRGKIHLTVKHCMSGSSFSRVADRVLLATGHWVEEKKQTNYFPSPWPAEKLLRQIPDGAKIAVIGTSLSAIEVVLTLFSNGHFTRNGSGKLIYMPPRNPRQLVLYSRRGLLPKVRGKMGAYRNTFLTYSNLERLLGRKNGSLTLEAVFQLLNADLESAYGHSINWNAVVSPEGSSAELLQKYLADAKNGDGPHGELIWQTVLHQSFGMIREVYLRLSPKDKLRFDREYTSIFFTHAATQPIINAEKMLALMKSGLVEVVKLGSDYRFLKSDSKDAYEFVYRDSSGIKTRDSYRYVVNARGQPTSIQTDPSPLTKNLLKRGIVQTQGTKPLKNALQGSRSSTRQNMNLDAGQIRGVRIDPATHQLIRQTQHKTSETSCVIYAVGAMTRDQIIDASMARGIVASTAIVAKNLFHDLF